MPELTSIDDLLEQMVSLGASDLHVTVGSPPAFRVRGHIARAEGYEPFTSDDTRALLYRVLSSEQQKNFELKRQLDFAYSMPGVARFRVNVYYQREIGPDATSFAEALKAALRQDPDVILVGEMRDLETISTALTAAETGHLVFGTLHTQSAPSTIGRIIDVFPPEGQEQVRIMIANSLQAIVTQALLPTADGAGRVAALEILLPDDAVRNLIRQAKIEQVYSVMQTNTARGMQTMEQALADLAMRRVVDLDVALTRSSRPDELMGILERAGFDVAAARAQAEAAHSGAPALRMAGS